MTQKNPEQAPPPARTDMARISLGIGIAGVLAVFIPPFFFFTFICGPVGLLGAVLGFMALRQVGSGQGRPEDRVPAVLGIILGVLPMLALLVIFIFYLATGQIDPLVLP